MTDSTICIVYISDENYISLTAISIFSLIDNSKEDIAIWVIDTGISEKSIIKLKLMVSHLGAQINFIKVNHIENQYNIPITIHSNTSVYNNLFLASLLKLKKVIYLDGDTIILSSLKGLWNIDLEGYYLAGVRDTTGIVERAEAGIGKDELYINSGVMYCNLEEWRKNNLEQKFVEYLTGHDGEYIFRSQRIINAVCKNKVKEISPKYNLLPDYLRLNSKQICKIHQSNTFCSERELVDAKNNMTVIHYAGREFNRPWFYGCIHPFKTTFFEYENKSGWNIQRKKYRLKPKIQIEKILIEFAPKDIYAFVGNLNYSYKARRKGLL